jgi:hypothetical protein
MLFQHFGSRPRVQSTDQQAIRGRAALAFRGSARPFQAPVGILEDARTDIARSRERPREYHTYMLLREGSGKFQLAHSRETAGARWTVLSEISRYATAPGANRKPSCFRNEFVHVDIRNPRLLARPDGMPAAQFIITL